MLTRFKTRVLKFIDHWMGGPICLFFALIQRMTHPLPRSRLIVPLKEIPREILVIKFFGLGSIVLSSPLLKAIKVKYPQAKIIFLTFDDHKDLVKRLHFCDEIKTISIDNPLILFSNIFTNLIYFWFHKPDICIDLEYYSKFSTLLSFLSGAKWRIGFYLANFWRNSLVNIPIPFNSHRHILEIYAMMGQSLSVKIRDFMPSEIPIDKKEKDFINKLLAKEKIKEDDFLIGVNINASDLALCRKWPKERFALLINNLLKKYCHLKVILTGSQDEKEYTASILPLLNETIKSNVLNFAGTLTLGEFLALLKRLHLLITNDSGPFHLAKAQRLPTVSLWGPGSPELYGPYQEEKTIHTTIYKKWSCSPCLYLYRTEAGHFCNKTIPCLMAIETEEVIHLVEEAIFNLQGKSWDFKK